MIYCQPLALLFLSVALAAQDLAVISSPSRMGWDTTPPSIQIVDIANRRLVATTTVAMSVTADSLALVPESKQVFFWGAKDEHSMEQVVVDLRDIHKQRAVTLPIKVSIPGNVIMDERGFATSALFDSAKQKNSDESGYLFFASDGQRVLSNADSWLHVRMSGQSFYSDLISRLRLFYDQEKKILSHAVSKEFLASQLMLAIPQDLIAGIAGKQLNPDEIALEMCTNKYIGLSVHALMGNEKSYFLLDRTSGSWVSFAIPEIHSTVRNMGEWFVADICVSDVGKKRSNKVLFRRFQDAAWTPMIFSAQEEVLAVSEDSNVIYCKPDGLYLRKLASEEVEPSLGIRILGEIDLRNAHWATWVD